MNEVELVVIHCSATKPGQDVNAEAIRKMHLRRGWSDIGYHFIVLPDGTIEKGREVFRRGAHVRGYNTNSLGICYVGGLDKNGNASDTRTIYQQSSILKLLGALKVVFPELSRITGHRGLSPDKDGDGVVEKHEWLKECPCFDAESEYKFILDL